MLGVVRISRIVVRWQGFAAIKIDAKKRSGGMAEKTENQRPFHPRSRARFVKLSLPPAPLVKGTARKAAFDALMRLALVREGLLTLRNTESTTATAVKKTRKAFEQKPVSTMQKPPKGRER